nr:ATP-binding protein [Tumebacillus amylolyticus]
MRIEKTGVISELAASVAHEVRNPLTVVRGFLQLLQERLELKEQDRQYMGLVMGELDRAESILGEYLSFAKPQIETFDSVDVSALVESLGTIVLPLSNASGVQFVLEVEPGLVIEGDRSKLQQCLLNITKNAIEACMGAAKAEVKVIADRHQDAVRIRVVDNGCGMSQEHVRRLGTPYYSMKDKGTGLGLMTTFRLVEAMRGKLKFHSRQGAGTTAVLQFASVQGQGDDLL